MKKCPKCGQTYADKDLNFCYNDGELLAFLSEEPGRGGFSPGVKYADEPPTVFMDAARVTSETNWPLAQASPAGWQENQTVVQTPFSHLPTQVTRSQTLAIVSLCLGVGAITVGWCCSSGFVLSPAALIAGIIALFQIKKDPMRFGGRGFAIGGIITAAVFLLIYLVIIIIYLLALLAGSAAGQ